MNATTSPTVTARIPLWLKVSYTLFMAVLIPVYWYHYGVTNFLYFCDIALLLALVGIWRESRLLISLPAAGILLPQALWCLDFVCELLGFRLTGMTSYMFEAHRPLYLRALSLFHGWLPFMLVYLVSRLGYDRRAFAGWSLISTAACLVSWFFLPAPGDPLPTPQTPVNVNYVFGMSETQSQQFLSPEFYLIAWITGLILLVYLPAHKMLGRFYSTAGK